MKYIGAEYIGNVKIMIGKTREVLENGTITNSITEKEAKARPEFKPVYSKEKKNELFSK